MKEAEVFFMNGIVPIIILLIALVLGLSLIHICFQLVIIVRLAFDRLKLAFKLLILLGRIPGVHKAVKKTADRI